MGSILRAQDHSGQQGDFPPGSICGQVYADTGGVPDEHGLLEGQGTWKKGLSRIAYTGVVKYLGPMTAGVWKLLTA